MGCGPSAKQDARAQSQDESQERPSITKKPSKLQRDPGLMGDISGARDAWCDAATPRALRAPCAARRLLTLFAARVAAGLNIVVRSASGIPAMDLRGHADPYVIVEVLGPAPDGAPTEASSRNVLGSVVERSTRLLRGASDDRNVLAGPEQTSVAKRTGSPTWDETLVLKGQPLEEWPPLDKVNISFRLNDKDEATSDDFIGQAIIPLVDLIKRPTRTLLIIDKSGNAVVAAGKPPMPCQLVVSVVPQSMPAAWPRPVASKYEKGQYAKHILIMSRGTRGDVQPFVALARGMAEAHNWLVTFATELRWREFVLAKTRNLSAGAVRFRPTGGDTTARIDTWTARMMMESKSEVAQCMMLAWSEADFFASGPVLVSTAEELQQSAVPVDLLIHSFTLTGLAMLVSERCQVPMAGFILQPSSIPSADKDWKCVGLLEGGEPALL